jgi:hypothetical protein
MIPDSPVLRLQNAKRCHAKSKRTGERCKGAVVKGWDVCRHHGARGGRPIKHGRKSNAAKAIRKQTGALVAETSRVLKLMAEFKPLGGGGAVK